MPYIGKKPADIIATVIDTTTGTFSGEVDAGSLDVSGNADIDGITNLDNTDIDGTLNVQGETTLQTHLNMGDNDIIKLGDSADLQIYHDGANSRIQDGGTGNLVIRASTGTYIQGVNGENGVVVLEDGAVSLWNDGSQKLATTSTGIDVIGTTTMDGLTVDGDSDLTHTTPSNVSTMLTLRDNRTTTSEENYIFAMNRQNSTTPALYLGNNDSNNAIIAGNNTATLIGYDVSGTFTPSAKFNNNGDISFYEDTGTTPKFFWDASDEQLGIGTTSPGADLHISSIAPLIRMTDTNDSNVDHFINGSGSALVLSADENNELASSTLRFKVDGSERMRITSGGSVGIGTSSPISAFDTVGKSMFGDSATTYTNIISGNSQFQPTMRVARNTADSAITIERFNNASGGPFLHFGKGRSTTIGDFTTAVSDNDILGQLIFSGSDGDQFRNAAVIRAEVDGTPGNDDMPGRIVFAITSDGSQSVTERMRIDSSGNVGIGDTSGNSKLIVQSGDAPPTTSVIVSGKGSVRLSSTQTRADGIGPSLVFEGRVSTGGAQGDLAYIQGANDSSVDGNRSGRLVFAVANGSTQNITEAMRIDNNGDLLVGKTSADNGVATGFEVEGATGRTYITADGADPVIVNRNTSDGMLVRLRKDGLTVGSIGTNGGQPYFINSSNKGIRPYTSGVAAAGSAGAFDDAAQDLGASSVRWRNLYLSGGAYIGGTGSANYLDDYEEGTFTPSYSGGGGPTFSAQVGRYTKIGNRVIANLYIAISSKNTMSGTQKITALPFVSENTGNNYNACSIWMGAMDSTGVFNGNQSREAFQVPNTTNIQIYAGNGSGGVTQLNDTHIANTTDIMLTVSYNIS